MGTVRQRAGAEAGRTGGRAVIHPGWALGFGMPGAPSTDARVSCRCTLEKGIRPCPIPLSPAARLIDQHADRAVTMHRAGRLTAELGVTLAGASQGKGIATEALIALVSVLFEDHGLHRIFAETDERNLPVHRLFERIGFRCEARLVEADWFKREWSTLRIYALLEREWRARTATRPGAH